MNEMDLAGMTLADLREHLASARIQIRGAKGQIEDAELAVRNSLLANAGGDVKAIGSNEQLREDRYRSEYAKRTEWIKAKADLLEAQDAAEMLTAVIEGRLDHIAERRLDADEARTQVVYHALEKGMAGVFA